MSGTIGKLSKTSSKASMIEQHEFHINTSVSKLRIHLTENQTLSVN